MSVRLVMQKNADDIVSSISCFDSDSASLTLLEGKVSGLCSMNSVGETVSMANFLEGSIFPFAS